MSQERNQVYRLKAVGIDNVVLSEEPIVHPGLYDQNYCSLLSLLNEITGAFVGMMIIVRKQRVYLLFVITYCQNVL